MEAPAGGQILLWDEIAGGDDDAVLHAVEQPLRPGPVAFDGPDERPVVAVVVVPVVEAGGGLPAGGEELRRSLRARAEASAR